MKKSKMTYEQIKAELQAIKDMYLDLAEEEKIEELEQDFVEPPGYEDYAYFVGGE